MACMPAAACARSQAELRAVEAGSWPLLRITWLHVALQPVPHVASKRAHNRMPPQAVRGPRRSLEGIAQDGAQVRVALYLPLQQLLVLGAALHAEEHLERAVDVQRRERVARAGVAA